MRSQFDSLDVPAFVSYALAGVVSTGIGSIELFGTKLSEVLATVAGFDIDIAFLVMILSVVAIGVTNEIDPTDFEGVTRLLSGVTVAVMVLTRWVPELNDALMSSDILGLAVYTLYTGAVGFIVYNG